MSHPHRRIALARAAAPLACLLALASCAESPTEPAPRPVVHRTVTAVLRDSLGSPVASAGLVWTAQFDSAGLVEIRHATTDEDGACAQVLAEGGWIIVTQPGPRAAGASLVVSGPERSLADTQAVALTMHTASRVRGTVTLAGRTDHAGTIVFGDAGGFALTDSTGAWALDGLPLGRWMVWMENFGFKPANLLVDVTAPGSVVTAPAVTLVSDP